MHCIPGLTCSSSLQPCFVIATQCLKLETTARPNLPNLGAGELSSCCAGSCPTACVVPLCSWLPLTCGTVDFHCFLTSSPGIHPSFKIATTVRWILRCSPQAALHALCSPPIQYFCFLSTKLLWEIMSKAFLKLS